MPPPPPPPLLPHPVLTNSPAQTKGKENALTPECHLCCSEPASAPAAGKRAHPPRARRACERTRLPIVVRPLTRRKSRSARVPQELERHKLCPGKVDAHCIAVRFRESSITLTDGGSCHILAQALESLAAIIANEVPSSLQTSTHVRTLFASRTMTRQGQCHVMILDSSRILRWAPCRTFRSRDSPCGRLCSPSSRRSVQVQWNGPLNGKEAWFSKPGAGSGKGPDWLSACAAHHPGGRLSCTMPSGTARALWARALFSAACADG